MIKRYFNNVIVISLKNSRLVIRINKGKYYQRPICMSIISGHNIISINYHILIFI